MRSRFYTFIKPFLNWKFLISFGLAWLVMNGWSIVFVILGGWLGITWMTASGGVWLGILAMPNGVGVAVSMPLALGLQMLLFKGDEKLRGDIMNMKWEAERKSLKRFLTAQNEVVDGSGGISAYTEALVEIKSGQKIGHWMWFIFPQAKGLGSSELSEYYGLSGRKEAKRYLRNKTLKNRLYEAVNAVIVQVYENGKSVEDIFGKVDAMKFFSCVDIFDLNLGFMKEVNVKNGRKKK